MLLRLVNYVDKTAGSDTFRVGLLTDDSVLDLNRLKDACGEVKSACDCPECWKSALGIVTCPSCLEAAQGYADWFRTRARSCALRRTSPSMPRRPTGTSPTPATAWPMP